MPNGEQERAARSIARGKAAGGMIRHGMDSSFVKSYVSEQGDKESEARFTNRRIGKEAGYSTDPIKSYKHGGKVKKTGIYKLHAGETVVPANESPDQFRRRKLGHRY